jgi:hypothetical protein
MRLRQYSFCSQFLPNGSLPFSGFNRDFILLIRQSYWQMFSKKQQA